VPERVFLSNGMRFALDAVTGTGSSAKRSGPSDNTTEIDMNWDQIEGNWKQLKGKVKQQWGKLTDDDLDELDGNRDLLVGKIQEQYGISKEDAEQQLRDWAGRQQVR
jgi:uncharacterized protein YjbJ (UPF0337 family)